MTAIAPYSDDPLRARILSLLAAGVSQGSTALACGVTDGYVSQLLTEPEFLQALTDSRVEKVETAIAHDSKIEDIEAKALKALGEKVPFVRNAMEAAKIFQILNNAKKRSGPAASESTGGAGAQQVNIVLPRAAQVAIQLNSNNQVVEVAGRSMATLPSRALPSLAAERIAAKDTAQAANILDKIASKEHMTIINGVPKLL